MAAVLLAAEIVAADCAAAQSGGWWGGGASGNPLPEPEPPAAYSPGAPVAEAPAANATSVAAAPSAAATSAAAPSAAAISAAAPSDVSSFSGVASWYGPGFAGRLTSSGETYDPNKLTAANRSLPFGTLVLVRNLDNGSSVVVRINDRGPFARGRVIDLSEAAARLIGMLPTGTARVSCSVIPSEESLAWKGGGMDGRPLPPNEGHPGEGGSAFSGSQVSAAGVDYGREAPASSASREHVRIQVASYASQANAQATLVRLQNSGLSPRIERAGPYYRVVFPDLQPAEAQRIRMVLNDMGYRLLLVTSWTDAAR